MLVIQTFIFRILMELVWINNFIKVWINNFISNDLLNNRLVL